MMSNAFQHVEGITAFKNCTDDGEFREDPDLKLTLDIVKLVLKSTQVIKIISTN